MIISNEFQNPKESIDFTNTPILFGITDNIGNPKPLDTKLIDFSVILKLNIFITLMKMVIQISLIQKLK